MSLTEKTFQNEYVDYKTKIIIFGFVNEIQHQLRLSHGNNPYYEIPTVIMNICLSYYFMEDRGSFQWKINKLILKQLGTVPHETSIQSKAMQVTSNIKWKVFLFPNGSYGRRQIGYFNMMHNLIEINPNWSQIIIFQKWSFKELEQIACYSSGSGIAKYNISNKFTTGGRHLLFSLKTFKTANLSEMTLNFEFKILQIINKNNDIILRYRLRDYKSNRINLEWKVSKNELLTMKRKPNYLFSSPIYNEMWCVTCSPKRGDKCYFGLYLCALPTKISKIDANCSINVYDGNDIIAVNSIIKPFDYVYNTHIDWDQHILSYNREFRHIQSLSICVYIKVIKKYDLDGNEIKT